MPFVDEAFLQSTAAKVFLACGALKVLFIIACGGPRAHDFSGMMYVWMFTVVRCHVCESFWLASTACF